MRSSLNTDQGNEYEVIYRAVSRVSDEVRCGTAIGQTKSEKGGLSMEKIIVAAVAWMPTYQSRDEPAFSLDGWHMENLVGGEALNFLPTNGLYHGYVRVPGDLNLRKHYRDYDSDTGSVRDVHIVFAAPDPDTRTYKIVGAYLNAEAFSEEINDPYERSCVHFTSWEAFVVPQGDRFFWLPNARRKDGYPTGIGMSRIWYGLEDDRLIDLKEEVLAYLADNSKMVDSNETKGYEYRKLRYHSSLERRGNYSGIAKKEACDACGWTYKSSVNHDSIWRASLELHHKHPISDLKPGEERPLTQNDFATLCANCHRAIHRTSDVEDIELFRKRYIMANK